MSPVRSHSAACAMLVLLVAGAACGQSLYKIVTPDGKVIYSDKPPAAGQGSVQQLQRPQPSGMPVGAPGPVTLPMPGGPGVAIVPGVAPAPPVDIIGALRGSKEMDDSRECQRANAAALSLIRAAKEVMRSVNNSRISGSKGASAYQNELLERQWKYYKSLGGTAASPEQVRPPEDPCRQASEALEQKGAVLEAQYRECVAAHPKEMKLTELSRQLVVNRGALAMIEKLQAEKRRNPAFDADAKGGRQWTAALSADPAKVRALLDAQFQEYRGAGGPASRLEDVSAIPNPCTPEPGAPSRPSPITARRTLVLPGK